jgi:hypothetical protein
LSFVQLLMVQKTPVEHSTARPEEGVMADVRHSVGAKLASLRFPIYQSLFIFAAFDMTTEHRMKLIEDVRNVSRRINIQLRSKFSTRELNV